jgi:lipid-A-disaccharide synthase
LHVIDIAKKSSKAQRNSCNMRAGTVNTQKPTIALVAGEASGDQLGAALIGEFRKLCPAAVFVGIGGQRMHSAGMNNWWNSEELAVFGLFEVLSHFPRLYRIRRELRQRLLALKPDVFIGIDAPDFNLGLESTLRSKGIRTVHYVSPTVWAWRKYRVRKIARAADLMLCLFPFEPAFYEGHGVSATYVGHPMADQISADLDPATARQRLGMDTQGIHIALLPGSRAGEVSKLDEPMIEAARILAQRIPGIHCAAAMANSRVRIQFETTMERLAMQNIQLVDEDPRGVIAAADVVLVASGTATLETMLINRPMVVSYRLAPSTYQLAKSLKLVRAKFFSLPNILAEEALVPELLQDDASGPRMAEEALKWLEDDRRRQALQIRFSELHEQLRCNASARAAEALAQLVR